MRSGSTGSSFGRSRAAFAVACLAVAFASSSFAQDDVAERDRPPAKEAPGDDAPPVKEIDIQESGPLSVEVCVGTDAVRGFDALDDGHVYLRAGRDEQFLLTMLHSCFGLRDAIEIGIPELFGRACTNTLSSVVYRSFGRMERCTIGRVEAVESKKLAVALIERRAD
jgi:Family of unknown function (DUF6491)